VTNKATCVEDCGLRFYKDAISPWTCKHCDFRCTTCTGPLNTECLNCDFTKEGVAKTGSSCVCGPNYVASFLTKTCESNFTSNF